MNKLQDKIAVIIGGGSWIGKEIAKKYASEGGKIFIAGLTLSKLEQTVNEIVDNGGYSNLRATGCQTRRTSC